MTVKLKYLLVITLLVSALNVFSQDSNDESYTHAYKTGEFLKYRVHYGFMNAGYASLKLRATNKNGQKVYHAKGKGWTTGAAKLFFKVQDVYESYFTSGSNVNPVYFKRRVNENGYLIQRDLTFNHNTNKVKVEDLKNKTLDYYPFQDVQDMVSAFYYLRNLDISHIEPGDDIKINLFFDGESFPFKLRFEKREVIKTKFGKLKTWQIIPMVQKGRVFKDQESLTIWVTDDANKLPVRIKAGLVVGSLKADLDNYRGLAHDLPVVVD
ncbi:MAG: ATP-dependent exonuclease [Flavobacteriia bacterium]|nr:MAG: ATP-dependent exonuclease [Flavobacteriia bacterium]